MQREELDILMTRSIDGIASRDEKEALARALKADPLLKSEYDDLCAAHASLNSLFGKLALPRDFTKRVMKRVQPHDVPADVDLQRGMADSPALRMPRSGRHRLIGANANSTEQKHGKLFAIYAIGSLSAAAGLLLVLGLVTGIIGNRPNAKPTSELQAESGGGVPHVREINRTDSRDSKPEEREASKGTNGPSEAPPTLKDGSSPNNPSDTTSNPGGSLNTPPQPKPEEPTPPVEARHDPVVPPSIPAPDGPLDPEQPEQPISPETPVSPEEPHTDVVKGPEPGAETGHATVPVRAICGCLNIVSGKAEIEGDDGKWHAIADGAEVSTRANLRTTFSGVAVLQLAHGAVVVGKSTRINLTASNCITLLDGELALERGRMDAETNGSLDAIFDGSTLKLAQGTAVVERRTGKKVEVHQFVGACSILRDGERLELEAGQTIAVQTGRAFDKPTSSKNYVLEDWVGDARADMVLTTIEQKLASRNPSRNDSTQIRRSLERMLRLDLSGDIAMYFAEAAVTKECFKTSDLAVMFEGVEAALADKKDHPVAGHTFDNVLEQAAAALDGADTLAKWQDAFKRARTGVAGIRIVWVRCPITGKIVRTTIREIVNPTPTPTNPK